MNLKLIINIISILFFVGIILVTLYSHFVFWFEYTESMFYGFITLPLCPLLVLFVLIYLIINAVEKIKDR